MVKRVELMASQEIDVNPVSGALGAEIFGVDISRPLSNQEFDEIQQMFLNHHVIFFRDQKLTPERQVEFARKFGQPDIYPFIKGIPETPEVSKFLRRKKIQSTLAVAGIPIRVIWKTLRWGQCFMHWKCRALAATQCFLTCILPMNLYPME